MKNEPPARPAFNNRGEVMKYRTVKEALAAGCVREDRIQPKHYGGKTITIKGVKVREDVREAYSLSRWHYRYDSWPKPGEVPHCYGKIYGHSYAMYRHDQVTPNVNKEADGMASN